MYLVALSKVVIDFFITSAFLVVANLLKEAAVIWNFHASPQLTKSAHPFWATENDKTLQGKLRTAPQYFGNGVILKETVQNLKEK